MSFLAPATCIRGEIDFIIGGDGRRVDLLPPVPFSQRHCIKMLLSSCCEATGLEHLAPGQRLLAHQRLGLGTGRWEPGTHSDTCSLLITLGVLLKAGAWHLGANGPGLHRACRPQLAHVEECGLDPSDLQGANQSHRVSGYTFPIERRKLHLHADMLDSRPLCLHVLA